MKVLSRLTSQIFYKIGLGLIKLFITAFFLFYIIYELDIPATKQFLLKTDFLLFCLSFILLISRTLIVAFRWKILLGFNNYLFSTMTLAKYCFIGMFFNLFLPSVVGGDAARWYYLSEEGVEHDKALSSIFFERFLGICSLILLASCSLFFDLGKVENSFKVAIIVFLMFCLAFFLMLWNSHNLFKWAWLKNFISRFKVLIDFIHNLKIYSQNSYILLYGLTISLIYQLMGIISTYILALSLGSTTPLLYFTILLPIVWLISMIPISIGGLGLREGSFIFLFVSVGMAKEIAVAISTLFLIQIIVQGILGGILFLFQKKPS